jgi:hypothetical protein
MYVEMGILPVFNINVEERIKQKKILLSMSYSRQTNKHCCTKNGRKRKFQAF